ncbi:hypothetical protein, partial [Tomitella biformata]|uniref:hypothetical protein n=1 Tax=Tomitella biformata TaxID=630403 RepID=UPI001A91DF1A
STVSRTRSTVCPGMTAEFLPAVSPTGLVEPADQRHERGERFARRPPSAEPGERGREGTTSP